MTFSKLLKNPIFWLIIIIILIGIIWYFVSKTTPFTPGLICETSKTKYVCDDILICADKCAADKTFDCKTKTCQCPANTKICGSDGICCTTCNNDVCCTEEQQITNANGSFECCGPGTIPDSTKTKCMTICGIQGGPCSETNQTCSKLTNLNKISYDKMVSEHSSDPTWRGNEWDDSKGSGTVYFCSDPPTCMWSEAQALPNSIGNANTYYNTSPLGGTDYNSLCLPKDGDTSCYNRPQSDCDVSKCDWVNIADSYSKDNVSLENKLNQWNIFKNESVLGHYCGDNTGSWGRLEKVTKDPISKNCTWQDCYNRIANKGTVDVIWDSSKSTCTALKTGNSNSGIQSLVKCNGENDPCTLCTTDNIGSYVNCIRCNSLGSPCSECKETEYIPSDKCSNTNSNWNFVPCVKGNNKVLKYDPMNNNSGNCPWGCDDPSATNCIDTTSDPPNVFGQQLIGTSESCFGDGQIRSLQPNFWRVNAPPSGHACKTKSDTCDNPGKSICTSSKLQCNDGESGCYATSSDCESRNSCDIGWLKNVNKTDCNIFMCTKDGSLANRNVSPGTISNQGQQFFNVDTFINPDGKYCRRNAPTGNANDRDYCRVNGFKCAGGGAPLNSIGPGYYGDCKYQVTQCTGSAKDSIKVFDGAVGGPTYLKNKYGWCVNEGVFNCT